MHCRDGFKLRREAVNSNAEPMAPLPPGGDAYEWTPLRCQLPPLDRATVCRRLGGSRVLLVGDSVLQQVGELYHDCYTIARLWLQVFYSLALTLGAAQGMKVRHI